MSALVSFRNVSVTLGRRPILHNLSLEVDAGDTLVLLGRSGSGKTTALKTVNALIVPTSGEVLVEGTPTTAWDPIRLRRRIGYAIQEGGLFPHFTVADNIALVPRLEHQPAAEVHARVTALLNTVGLPADVFGMRYPKQLSGGQRQRVGVARALAADPPLLLFDEPFGGLDPVTRLDLQQEFVSLRQQFGKTAMFVTHDVREALVLATRIALMVNGAVDFIGTPREFLQAQTAEAKAFLACLQPLEVTCR